MLTGFLSKRGFSDLRDLRTTYGTAQSQILSGVDDQGNGIAMWVRLCWRNSEGRSASGYSAAQLRSKIDGGDWLGTLAKMMDHEKNKGITHLLLVQRSKNVILHAAAIPIDSVIPIWVAQRDISDGLIRAGKLGNRTKNHAMNGASPTLWLKDDKAPAVAKVLWRHRGVRDLSQIPLVNKRENSARASDSFDDLPGLDYSTLGSDGAVKFQRVTSGVKRNPKVRLEVLRLSGNSCERNGCGGKREYPGFIDVHHILGAEKGDRVWNCVALCPNCHRESHFSPDRAKINSELLTLAQLRYPAQGRRLR
jgi:5-methylcytosine-specific restriction protein A